MESPAEHVEKSPELPNRGRIFSECPVPGGGVNFAVRISNGSSLLIFITDKAIKRCGLAPGRRIGVEIEWDMAGGYEITNIRLVNVVPGFPTR